MKQHIFPALRLTAVCLVLFCGVYTVTILGIAKLMNAKGEGLTITQNGKTYYANIGQRFNKPQYFWCRPSGVNYNAAGSGGSNQGPSNPAYLVTVQQRIDSFLKQNGGVQKTDIPADLVTASGSGIDPDISLEAAFVQAKRIAATRKISLSAVNKIIEAHEEKPLLGLFGTARVNVLKLNLGLDEHP